MAENFWDCWGELLSRNNKVGLHETTYRVIAGSCLDRLVKHKNEGKQVPIDDCGVKSQSYYCDSVYESGPRIVLDP
jgi:hypothetical protein